MSSTTGDGCIRRRRRHRRVNGASDATRHGDAPETAAPHSGAVSEGLGSLVMVVTAWHDHGGIFARLVWGAQGDQTVVCSSVDELLDEVQAVIDVWDRGVRGGSGHR